MRVIAGEAKGARLKAPKGPHVRPTLDRVREGLFSIIAPRLDGTRFLDLFAGSGANGIEALSRGAHFAAFVDSSRVSTQAIEANLDRTHLKARAAVLRGLLPQCLTSLPQQGARFDLIFADPPYKWLDFDALLTAIGAHALLSPEGLVVLEHARDTELKEGVGGFGRTRQVHYGDTALSFYARKA